MFCIFRYLCVTVYIQLFSFRAASVCLISSVVSCQCQYEAKFFGRNVESVQCFLQLSTTRPTTTTTTTTCRVTLTMPFLAIPCINFVAILCSKRCEIFNELG